MNKLLELGNRYAQKSDWKDFALTKFCLCAMGIIIGINVPKKNKVAIQSVSTGIFISTYIILMTKVFKIIQEMYSERKNSNRI